MDLNKEKSNRKKKITLRQIVAAAGSIVLLGMYITSLVLACLAKPDAAEMFMASLAMTVGLPILLYVLLLFDRLAKSDKKNGKSMTMAELRRYNKRMEKGENPDQLAEEIKEKFLGEQSEQKEMP